MTTCALCIFRDATRPYAVSMPTPRSKESRLNRTRPTTHACRADTFDDVSPARQDADRFVQLVMERLIERAGRSRLSTYDADDAVQRCAEKLLVHLDDFVVAYTDPRALAAALWRSGPADHRRAERIQRCQGARLPVDDDRGGQTGGRTILSLDRLQEAGSAELSRRLGVVDDSYEQIDDRDEVVRLLDGVVPSHRTLLWLVHGEGRSVTEAAPILGWSRCHASRQLSRVDPAANAARS